MASSTFKKKALTWLVRVGIGLGIGILVALIRLWDPGFIQSVDHLSTDYRYQQRHDRLKASGELWDAKKLANVVIIGIGEDDMKSLPESFPFPRSYYAHIIENLERSGVRAIGLDVTFESKRDSASDAAFDAVLKKYNNIVLAAKYEESTGGGKYRLSTLERSYSNIFYQPGRRVGIVSIAGKDRDDVARRYLPMIYVGNFLTPTFGFALLNSIFGLSDTAVVELRDRNFVLADRLIPRYDGRSFLLNYYGPSNTFRYIKFTEVIDDSTFKTKEELEYDTNIDQFDSDPELQVSLKDKIVLIGSTMPEERDFHSTPLLNIDGMTSMNGVEIHATAIQNILDQSYIQRAEPTLEFALIIILALVVTLILMPLRTIKIRYVVVLELASVFVVALFIFGVFEIAVRSFTNNSTLINIVYPSLAVVLAYVGAAVYQYLAERQQKALIKNVFSKYISSAVVNELVANPEKAKLGGDRRELTVFFSDIAGFTTISEQFHTRPEGLVELLNEYLDEMTGIVLKHEGTLDKYEGDAIMAFWGAPITQKDHALRTCLASLEMQKRLAVMRPKWKKEGRPGLEVRIGINTGVMIVGNMGGKDRFDYTVIGDSVNLASRLEGANKQYGSNIMISDFTYQHVKGQVLVRELDLIQVKGKTEPVKVWELLGASDTPMSDNQKQSLEIYHEGLRLYRERSWQEAIAYFQQAKQLDPTCHVADIYEQRANLYQINPPPAGWNGVFVMTTK
ncbi:MAG: CHASE2 domain-containing protein [Ignavibacteriales bacterium]|nr:CHASE2 domain-containing protein [Ignavibacteriales bacterium]